MAWIEVETTTVAKPEVIGLAATLAIPRAHALGLLVVWWSWCDANMVDGVTRYVTRDAIDDLVGHVGFASALQQVGWLTIDGAEVSIPRFDRHHGNSAKKRRQAAERQRRHRDRVTQSSRTERDRSVTTEQDRTQQIVVEEPPTTNDWAAAPDPGPPIDWMTAERDFFEFWSDCPNVVKPTTRGIPHELHRQFQERWADAAWRELFPRAISWLGRRRPWHGRLVTLREFLAPQFVAEFIQLCNDEEKSGGNTRRSNRRSRPEHLSVGAHASGDHSGGYGG